MNIEDQCFVSIEYVLTIDDGQVVDESPAGEPLGFIYGGGHVVKGLEKGLNGKAAGDKLRITVEPDEGYGMPMEQLIKELPRESFPKDANIKQGMFMQAMGPHGPMNFQIADISDDLVKADFNHPLAGKRLHFDVKVTEVREVTEEDRTEAGCSSCGCSCSGAGHSH